ncbi:COG4315 family predicted lipoprotein [Dictyobacter alpinus]|uniref:COG4315 family predicted lipoprotein n=1 Tax=Dictyobacter alpinus TaxID=2014873 RepID=UPI001C3F7AA3|nr:hypothetical protein [Dictyobacter alpinus]
MRSLRISVLFCILALTIFLFAACGTESTNTDTGTTNTSSTNNSDKNSYGNSNATPTTSASTSSSDSAIIKTASATLKGKKETILTDSHGLTLYYFTPDTKTTSACGSGCTGSWPPLLATGSTQPTSPTNLPGKLTVVKTDTGQQIQYNGHFLYTYAGDSAPGQTSGDGLGGKWFVATGNLS